jgi:hypothetical protein
MSLMAKGVEFEEKALKYLSTLFNQLGFTVTEAQQQHTGTQNGFDIRIGFLDDNKRERKSFLNLYMERSLQSKRMIKYASRICSVPL